MSSEYSPKGSLTLTVLSMVVASKVEQFLITNRSNSYVPADTMAYWLGIQGFR
jgi:hypothetical protein